MKVFTNRIAILRPAVVVTLLLIQSTLCAQALETSWSDFLSVDARVKAATELERGWREQQRKLGEEIRSLQQSQSWYNGWIIELRLARKSALQVELADSLQQTRKRIAAMEVQRNKAFLALRKAYQQILLEAEPVDRLSQSQKEQVLAIGRRLLSQSDAPLELPDYASILTSPYEHEDIKRLVLKDLQSVLQAKLVLIDSLLTEKETELALLTRLNEFHRDLSYQMKSSLDLKAGSGYLEATGSAAPDRSTFGEVLEGESDGSTYLAEKGNRDLATSLDQSPVGTEETGIQLDINPIDEVINRLKYKRQQYQELLIQIETELPL